MNLSARVLADLILLSGLVGMAVFSRAWASEVTSALAVAVVQQLPAILTGLAVLVTALAGLMTLVLKRVTQVKAETAEIKKDVNSQFSALKAELALSKGETAALRQVIADKPGATSEEQMRAVIAKEQQARPAPLPKDT